MTRKKQNEIERGTVGVVLGLIESGSLEHAQNTINAAIARAQAEGVHNLRIELCVKRGYYDDHEAECQIVGWRNETDEELKIRQQERDRDLEYRRMQYLQLKKEFEGK